MRSKWDLVNSPMHKEQRSMNRAPEAAVGRGELLVVHDRLGGSGRRNVGGDTEAFGPGQHGAPVLQALGQRVVRALHAGQPSRDE